MNGRPRLLDLFCGGGAAMGYHRAEVNEAIPPAYTEWIGAQLLAALGWVPA